jgi:quinolinate synthase
MELIKKIQELKKEKNAVILAHYYQNPEIQEIADYVGDSYYLSKVGQESNAEVIVYCGVRFMAESAKILSPAKTVLFPVYTEAPCCMEFMVNENELKEFRKENPDAKVVCYINSSTEVKALSDVCCTSSSAENILKNIDADKIIFIPDRNLASYVAEKVPEKEVIPWAGCCNIHDKVSMNDVKEFLNTDITIVAHPECQKEIRDIAHYVGSTSGILNHIKNSSEKEFLVLTEKGIHHQLKKDNPNKDFHFLHMICGSMKKTFLETVAESLETFKGEVTLDEDLRKKAYTALENMHKLG